MGISQDITQLQTDLAALRTRVAGLEALAQDHEIELAQLEEGQKRNGALISAIQVALSKLRRRP